MASLDDSVEPHQPDPTAELINRAYLKHKARTGHQHETLQHFIAKYLCPTCTRAISEDRMPKMHRRPPAFMYQESFEQEPPIEYR